MDTGKIKTLREKIAIPLDVAITLLKKNNGDISICEKEFHNENINEICKIAECDEETANRYYKVCNCDKIKAIDRINSRQIVISTREKQTQGNEIGFILWPEKANGENYKTTKRNDVFIPTADFDYIINEFKSVFPLENTVNKQVEESFDPCGHNFFDNKTCRLIVDSISEIKTDKPVVDRFIKELINWLNDKLEYADFIVVYGNL
jgi:hypothetical protein